MVFIMFKKIFFLDILLGFSSLNYLKNTFLRGNNRSKDTAIKCLWLLILEKFLLNIFLISDFSDYIVRFCNCQIFTLNNILKLQSLTHHQFSSFQNLFKFA